jgi:glucoamylase
MPLVWAHSEFLKLSRSIHEGAVFDLPPQPAEHYRDGSAACTRRVWRFNHKLRSVPVGTLLRIECRDPAVVHWIDDGWRSVRDDATRDGGCGVHYVDLPTQDLAPGSDVVFTFRWASPERREGTDYSVGVGAHRQAPR